MGYVYDPEVALMVPHAPALDVSNVVAARELLSQLGADLPPWEPGAEVDFYVTEIPGPPSGPSLDLFVMRPAEALTLGGALLWFHGGGFVLGDARESLPFLEKVALDSGILVASVQYRLAPETPYPGALDDGHAALSWLREHASELGIETHAIAVGGQSAGAALAAGLALRVRDEGGHLLFQALDIPVTDDRGHTQSAIAYTDTVVWHRANARASWQAYLRGVAGPTPTYAAPARAEDLGGLPPAVVTVNQSDPLRDEGIEYARRLAHANVPVDLHLYAGTFHGSASIAADAEVSQRQQSDLRAALARAFVRPTTDNPQKD